MIIIYQNIIKKYIKELKPIHIKDYASTHQIYVTDEEINIIYKFIMTYHQELLKDEKILKKIKPKLRPELYQTIENLYYENKTKYLT